MCSPRMAPPSAVTRWLDRASAPVFTAYVVVAAFSTYFCMYAFRKPFAVGTYEGEVAVPLLGALSLKSLYVIAQVLGYAASKFLGIKVVSEMHAGRRAVAIVGLVGASEVALVLFAVVPAPWAAVCLVLNGLPLGMIWGLVFGFIEGRRTSDLLGAGLCGAFIVASGFVKTVGKWLMDLGVSEVWMPAATGALFFGPLLLFVVMLAQVPPPTAADEAARTKRAPMDGAARRRFFAAYAPGLVALVGLYILLTAYRDFRDNFARELWDALGYADTPSVLTTAEVPVAFGALVAVALVMAVRDNRRALMVVHGLMFAAAALLGISTALFALGVLDPALWMIAVGLGLYVGYVPFNCVLFDRLIAAVGSVATAGFLIYVADAFGYLGSVGLLLYRDFAQPNLSWIDFFLGFSYVTAIVCGALYLFSAGYFWKRTQPHVHDGASGQS
jgi:MFS family permease